MDHLQTDNRKLAISLLQKTARRFQPITLLFGFGCQNPDAARVAAEISAVLGFDELAVKFSKILKSFEHVQQKEFARLGLKSIPQVSPLHELSEIYPKISDSRITTNVPAIKNSDYEAAFKNAESEFDKECVLLTQVLNGQIELAVQNAKVLESARQENVVFVGLGESYRSGQHELAVKLSSKLPSSFMSEWTMPQLSLIVSGRCWVGFPFPDS